MIVFCYYFDGGFLYGLKRMYLEAKAMDEGWNEFNVENWEEEFLGQPVQPDRSSCGVFVCLVRYFVTSFRLKLACRHVGSSF